MSIISDVIQSAKAVIKGMSITLSQIPKEKWTVQYPDDPVTVQPRYRGMHLLHVDEMGKEKCVACYLCAAACPSDCIYIEAETDPRPYEERIGRDERYARALSINRIDRARLRKDARRLIERQFARETRFPKFFAETFNRHCVILRTRRRR